MTDLRHVALYRFFNADGDLLYVGITLNPSTRFTEHCGERPWWHEVRRIEIERFPSAATVASAEIAAIRDETAAVQRLA